MADIFSKSKRSEVMRKIKGRGNKTTEVAFKKLLRKEKISGWRTRYKRLYGSPDFIFSKSRVAVFVDGCFWHRCPKCSRNLNSSTNKKFWFEKASYNKKHDRKVSTVLKSKGWKVLRFWEHEIQKKPDACMRRLRRLVHEAK